MNQLLGALIALLLLCLVDSKCLNSTQFRYDLKWPSQLVNYNSLCFEYSKRTCCSQNNLESLVKRIGKTLGSTYQLSHMCRRKLTNLLCSPCDADIGQGHRKGVCQPYCVSLYQQCSQDFFAIDANNQLKVCRQEDIICSKLKDIIGDKQKEHVCSLLSQGIDRDNCWNGEISAKTKGRGKQKIQVPIKVSKNNKDKQEQWQWMSGSVKVFLGCILFLLLVLLYQCWRLRYADWKRQIRNM